MLTVLLSTFASAMAPEDRQAVAQARERRAAECGGAEPDAASWDGVEPEVVARGQLRPGGIAVASGRVFWAVGIEQREGGGILALDPGASAPRRVADARYPGGPVVSADHVYWSTAEGDGSIWRAPVSGGAPERVATGTVFAVADGEVFVARDTEIVGIRAAKERRLGSLPPERTVDDLAADATGVLALASAPDAIGLELYELPARAPGKAGRIATERLGLHVTSTPTAAVFSTLTELYAVPRGGGSLRQLAQTPFAAHQLAADGERIYGTSECTGVVVAVDADGSDFRVLAHGLGMPLGVAVDAGAVYFTDVAAGLVLSRPVPAADGSR
jgi:hypothetical protein